VNMKKGEFLLVTTKHRKEELAKVEILDTLYPFDPEVKVEKVSTNNLLVKLKNIRRKEAIELLRVRSTAYIYRIIPVDLILRTCDESSLKKLCLELAKSKIPSGVTFAVRCRKRGKVIKNSSEFERELGRMIRESIEGVKVKLRNPSYIVMVQVLGEAAFISIIGPDELVRKKVRGEL